MAEVVYTLASWYVKEGMEATFVAAWDGDLVGYFSSLEGARWGTLLQSTEDPRRFYSFGPWDSPDAIAAMRADPRSREVFAGLGELCDEMSPGPFRVAASWSRPGDGPGPGATR